MSRLSSPSADDSGRIEAYCPSCDRSYPADVTVCPKDGQATVKLGAGRDALIGKDILGRFVLKERIGAGGMGTVYRAWQHSVGREVAVKVIDPRHGSDLVAAKRFLREVKLASRLSQPNVVTVMDFGQTDDGLLFLVMELLRGRTLARVLREDGAFPVDRMVRVGIQLCDALDAAHRLSIVHRDLKPGNVMILDEPRGRDFVKVLDFGLAKSLGHEDGSTVTHSGMVFGTPRYMPPEAVLGGDIDARSDLYSLGVILHELLSGRAAFEAHSVSAVLSRQLEGQPPPLPAHVPPVVENVIKRLLEKEPGDRFRSAADAREMLLALSELRTASGPMPVVSAPALARAVSPALEDAVLGDLRSLARSGDGTAAVTAPVEVGRIRVVKRSRKLWLAGGAAAAALLLGGGGYALLGLWADPAPPAASPPAPPPPAAVPPPPAPEPARAEPAPARVEQPAEEIAPLRIRHRKKSAARPARAAAEPARKPPLKQTPPKTEYPF